MHDVQCTGPASQQNTQCARVWASAIAPCVPCPAARSPIYPSHPSVTHPSRPERYHIVALYSAETFPAASRGAGAYFANVILFCAQVLSRLSSDTYAQALSAGLACSFPSIHPSISPASMHRPLASERLPPWDVIHSLSVPTPFFASVVHNLPLSPADPISRGASLPGVRPSGLFPRPTSDPRPREATRHTGTATASGPPSSSRPGTWRHAARHCAE